MKNELKNEESPPRFYEPSFKLTLSEKKFPSLVMNSFCDRYQMEDLRLHLKEWLASTQENELAFFIKFSRDIEKLLEAVFIKNEGALGGLIDKEGNAVDSREYYVNSFDEVMEEYTFYYNDAVIAHNKFEIFDHYLKYIGGDPIIGLEKLFYNSGDHIKLVLGVWIKAAVCIPEDYCNYDYQMFPRLQFFFKNFQRLIEALYILTVANVQSIDSLNDKLNMLQFPLLNVGEQRNPFGVVKRFCKTFPIEYAKSEIWQLLDAVIPSNKFTLVERKDILYHYEQFLCLLESAYALDPQDERIVNAIQKLSKVII